MEKNYTKVMQKCLELAKKGFKKTAPNPMVGAILLDENGKEIASGYHEMFAEAHAEVNCINNAEKTGYKDFSKTTLIVNLEPCSHFGKTPPCADLIVKRGIKKVVIGFVDPNPKVKGQGIKKLENAGVEVICPCLEKECKDLNKFFIKNVKNKKPFVAIKTASTLDAKIATGSLSSRWITSEAARFEVQKLRFEYDAILTGSNTVLIDDPNLTLRDIKGKSPIRIIMDRNFKTDFSNKVYKDDGTKVILITNEKDINPPQNVDIIPFENFDKLFLDLYKMGIYSVLVEAGSGLNSSLIKAKEADYLYHFIAPKILGGGKTFVENLEIEDINKCLPLEILNVETVSPDILIKARFLK